MPTMFCRLLSENVSGGDSVVFFIEEETVHSSM